MTMELFGFYAQIAVHLKLYGVQKHVNLESGIHVLIVDLKALKKLIN